MLEGAQRVGKEEGHHAQVESHIPVATKRSRPLQAVWLEIPLDSNFLSQAISVARFARGGVRASSKEGHTEMFRVGRGFLLRAVIKIAA